MPQLDCQLFQSFSDAIPFGVCVVDLQGKIIYWNLAAEGITGYLAHEVLGRAYRGDLLVRCASANGSTEQRCPVTEVLRDGRAVAAELFLRHKQGHRVPVRISAFALRDAMGEVRGVGEIFDPTIAKDESTGGAGRSSGEFEIAIGSSAVEESVEQLHTLLRSRTAATSALILIEMAEQEALFLHGGTALLVRAIRALAKTVAALLPARNYVGCWSDWGLIAIVPECRHETLETLRSRLAGVGSSCAVKWWGDRVVVRIRAAACCVDTEESADESIRGLEREMKIAMNREE
ncbi:MAG TPA: PAS domain-containing protein [Candidatus Saccharimonadales bacterium]|nr:PAS domain-containing protein [Candidatus Saccharimonadales bacterium]